MSRKIYLFTRLYTSKSNLPHLDKNDINNQTSQVRFYTSHLSCMFSLNFRETNTYMKIDKNCTTNKNIDKIIAYLS